MEIDPLAPTRKETITIVMCPKIVTIGPFTIYGFGLMMGIAFITASILLTRELKRKKLDPDLGNTITLIALVAGIAGSKILFLFENWQDFLRAPFELTFSASGLTWYGGFILALVCIYFYVKKKKISFAKITDATSPALMLGYGIARIGCHLSGDGDYGIPTSLPWGTNYENGTFPPSIAFRDFPQIARQFPGGIVPDNTPLHPTPVYEFILCTLFFIILWQIGKRKVPDGLVFMWYLILAGIERFAVEFIRINPPFLLGLSEAQVIALVLIALGIYGIQRIYSRSTTSV
jgi:phosphatidylglycerol:prolipoprotein diacylglycerol transferase